MRADVSPLPDPPMQYLAGPLMMVPAVPSPAEKTAARLLSALAAALNTCEDAGLRPRLKHGVVISDAGYVLPIGNGWVARTRAYTEFGLIADDED